MNKKSQDFILWSGAEELVRYSRLPHKWDMRLKRLCDATKCQWNENFLWYHLTDFDAGQCRYNSKRLLPTNPHGPASMCHSLLGNVLRHLTPSEREMTLIVERSGAMKTTENPFIGTWKLLPGGRGVQLIRERADSHA